ncbi:hypothetical protein TCAL_10088 [Tigriopus californicus]|uniref:FYVE-type domain-containing protein n=1 Tax=Tigriopus californicus TaxID=6832 RepID=A0A553PC45_TIGCA|nr:rabenosyn-5-like [Tigriopus californicus]TRY75257.1 hypothetical protein TCAL_10088 [Tigriopus californicus]
MADVKEGFLCPICMEDLGDVIQLQVHFEEKHSKEDPVFIQGLKDLFGKAKRRVLNSEAFKTNLPDLQAEQKTWDSLIEVQSLDSNIHPASGLHSSHWEDPDLKKLKTSHTSVFLEERRKRQGRNKRTNQVLIRLEKLVRNYPHDPAKRRVHEQKIVPWIDEDNVKLCPNCAKRFNFARRKHHCRLCGGVICNDCSTPTSLDLAKKVTQPIADEDDQATRNIVEDPMDSEPNGNSSFMAKLGNLTPNKRSGSQESINSIMSNVLDLKVKDDQLRTCLLCAEILSNEAQRLDAITQDTLLVRLYEQLKNHMREGSEISLEYCRMAHSLNSGEEDYQLDEAKYLRVKVLKIAENIDILSRKISKLGDTQNEETTTHRASPLELKLQQRIRAMAVDFIKDTLISKIPVLVSEEEYDKIKRERKQTASKKIAQEREAAKTAKAKFEQNEALKRTKSMLTAPLIRDEVMNLVRNSSTAPRTKPNPKRPVEYGPGFVLTSSPSQNLSASEDPMVQQIQNLKHFIQEAKKLRKLDEVRSLEESLRDIQAEYQRIQAERAELEANFTDFKGIFHKTSPSKAFTSESVQPEERDEEPSDPYDASGKNPFF